MLYAIGGLFFDVSDFFSDYLLIRQYQEFSVSYPVNEGSVFSILRVQKLSEDTDSFDCISIKDRFVYFSHIRRLALVLLREDEHFDALDFNIILSNVVSIWLSYNDGFFLHASAIRVSKKGIAFFGESGVGKSTQARLWEKYKDAEILNHDKPIIRFHQNMWYLYGSPWSGSTPRYVNDRCELVCLVHLKHSLSNYVSIVSNKSAFVELLEQVKFSFKTTSINLLLGIVEKLITEISIVNYECTKDYEAVKTLFEYLVEEGILDYESK